ncbi:MAG: hypothetical protein E7324_09205 [Clostridiales bacterium]|nr:hypothetical protein [Clostridiales bacterium]
MKNETDFSRAFGRADERFAACVQHTLLQLKYQEEEKMKKKFGWGVLVIALVLVLAMAAAVALTIDWKHIETAMDLARDSGAYFEWGLEGKIRLISDMENDGMEISPGEMEKLGDPQATEAEKEKLADTILTRYYGDEEYLYYYTMAEREWGMPIQWTLEQRAWFHQIEREKGLYGDFSWIDLVPEKTDISREKAVDIAKNAVMDAWDVTEEEMAQYEAGVSFFTTDVYDIPRWMVDFYIPRENTWSTAYTVLLTREGEVTEDWEDLGVLTPENAKKKKAEDERKALEMDDWQRRGKERLADMESVFFNRNGGQHYHFLSDCPLVDEKFLPLEPLSKDAGIFPLFTPCPVCVNDDVFWSIEDKVRYQCGHWPLPEEDWISPEEAIRLAKAALCDQGYDLKGLYPSLFTHLEEERSVYSIFFDDVIMDPYDGSVMIEPIYSVVLDAKTEEILQAEPNQSNG